MAVLIHGVRLCAGSILTLRSLKKKMNALLGHPHENGLAYY